MAMVDFSNARIEPVAYPGIGQGAFSTYSAVNPTEKIYISFYSNVNLWNADGGTISTNASISQLLNESKQMILLYQGTFNTSGTEFYIISYGNSVMGAWKVSNISFNSGDNYVFQINANLVCN